MIVAATFHAGSVLDTETVSSTAETVEGRTLPAVVAPEPVVIRAGWVTVTEAGTADARWSSALEELTGTASPFWLELVGAADEPRSRCAVPRLARRARGRPPAVHRVATTPAHGPPLGAQRREVAAV